MPPRCGVSYCQPIFCRKSVKNSAFYFESSFEIISIVKSASNLNSRVIAIALNFNSECVLVVVLVCLSSLKACRLSSNVYMKLHLICHIWAEKNMESMKKSKCSTISFYAKDHYHLEMFKKITPHKCINTHMSVYFWNTYSKVPWSICTI